jgi:hypothetical protein
VLSYTDVTDTPYTPVPQVPTFTPVGVTLLAFLLSQAESPSFWADYDAYRDEIETLLSATTAALLDGL